jgi:hypothetical protein
LAWAFPYQPSQAKPKSLLLRLVEIGDHGEKKTPAAESKKIQKSRALGPTRAVFVVLTSAEFRACGGAGSGDQCCAVTQSGFLSFNHFVKVAIIQKNHLA